MSQLPLTLCSKNRCKHYNNSDSFISIIFVYMYTYIKLPYNILKCLCIEILVPNFFG